MFNYIELALEYDLIRTELNYASSIIFWSTLVCRISSKLLQNDEKTPLEKTLTHKEQFFLYIHMYLRNVR